MLAILKANRHGAIKEGGHVKHPTTSPLFMKHMVTSP
jgi:hypothetical protein